jgi:hypothetical protein
VEELSAAKGSPDFFKEDPCVKTLANGDPFSGLMTRVHLALK